MKSALQLPVSHCVILVMRIEVSRVALSESVLQVNTSFFCSITQYQKGNGMLTLNEIGRQSLSLRSVLGLACDEWNSRNYSGSSI